MKKIKPVEESKNGTSHLPHQNGFNSHPLISTTQPTSSDL
jgi:hypothetical protein